MRTAPGVVLLAIGLASCGPSPETAAVRHPIAGQLLAVQLDTGDVLLKHDDIPGFMDAMTMPFRVAEPTSILDRRPGDLIAATLVIRGDRSVLEDVRLVGRAPLPDSAPGRPVAEGVHLLAPGDPVPGTPLTNHSGEAESLTGWGGAAGVVTFIYTRCPLPDYCPLMDRRFAAIQQAAAGDASLRGRVRLLSVSFDPDADTVAVLAEHARAAGAGPDWHFATAPRDEVDRFAAAFGVNVIRETDGSITHNLRTAVIGPDGRVAAVHSGNQWTEAEVLADLRLALGSAAATP
jgi:protein SCO1/2